MLVSVGEPAADDDFTRALVAELERRRMGVWRTTVADAEQDIDQEAPHLVVLCGTRGAAVISTLLDDGLQGTRPRLVVTAPRAELAKLQGLNRNVVAGLLASDLGERLVVERLQSLARQAAQLRQGGWKRSSSGGLGAVPASTSLAPRPSANPTAPEFFAGIDSRRMLDPLFPSLKPTPTPAEAPAGSSSSETDAPAKAPSTPKETSVPTDTPKDASAGPIEGASSKATTPAEASASKAQSAGSAAQSAASAQSAGSSAQSAAAESSARKSSSKVQSAAETSSKASPSRGSSKARSAAASAQKTFAQKTSVQDTSVAPARASSSRGASSKGMTLGARTSDVGGSAAGSSRSSRLAAAAPSLGPEVPASSSKGTSSSGPSSGARSSEVGSSRSSSRLVAAAPSSAPEVPAPSSQGTSAGAPPVGSSPSTAQQPPPADAPPPSSADAPPPSSKTLVTRAPSSTEAASTEAASREASPRGAAAASSPLLGSAREASSSLDVSLLDRGAAESVAPDSVPPDSVTEMSVADFELEPADFDVQTERSVPPPLPEGFGKPSPEPPTSDAGELDAPFSVEDVTAVDSGPPASVPTDSAPADSIPSIPADSIPSIPADSIPAAAIESVPSASPGASSGNAASPSAASPSAALQGVTAPGDSVPADWTDSAPSVTNVDDIAASLRSSRPAGRRKGKILGAVLALGAAAGGSYWALPLIVPGERAQVQGAAADVANDATPRNHGSQANGAPHDGAQGDGSQTAESQTAGTQPDGGSDTTADGAGSGGSGAPLDPLLVEEAEVKGCDALLEGFEQQMVDPVQEASLAWKDAREAIVKGNLALAERKMCEAVQLHKESAALEGLAMLYLTERAPKRALGYLERAEATRPETMELINLRGDILSQLGDAEGALAAWLKALKLEPDETARRRAAAREFDKQGQGHLRRGAVPQAERWFRRAAALDPTNILALNGLAEAFLQTERFAQAETMARRALDISEYNPQAHVVLGDVARQAGDLAAAKASYERALQVRSDHWVAKARLRELAKDQ